MALQLGSSPLVNVVSKELQLMRPMFGRDVAPDDDENDNDDTSW